MSDTNRKQFSVYAGDNARLEIFEAALDGVEGAFYTDRGDFIADYDCDPVRYVVTVSIKKA